MAMDVERLIESVKNHVFLYDIRHKDYKNTWRKTAVWETIANELNENSETVKLKWKTVRDGYIKYKKQQKEGKKAVNYIWSAQLRFLDDYQVSRKGKKSSVSLAKVLQLSEDESETPSQSYSPGSILIPSPSDSGPFRSEAPPPRRKRKEQDKDVCFLKSKKLKKENDYDATDHLFLSYSETFKTFELRQQALLKVELAKLFSKAELNALRSGGSVQESFVAGSSPINGVETQQVHTVEDDDSEDDDDDVEFVCPKHDKSADENSS